MTAPNPALSALGYGARDRVVIFHMDDLGMLEATVSAYREVRRSGLVSSASLMMPCAWTPAAAQAAREPGADVGVHLTLTSEWEACRWRPLTCPADRRLVDEGGFFHRRVEEARQADAPTVAAEVRAQLEAALALGVDVTHLDTHMGAAADPRYVTEVIKLATGYGLPLLFPRLSAAGWQGLGLSAAQAGEAVALAGQLEDTGFPLVDHVRMLPLEVAGDHTALTLALLRDLPPGLTHFILHPAGDTPELRATCPDHAARVADLRAFTDPALLRGVQDLGVQVSGYRPLRDLLRQRLEFA